MKSANTPVLTIRAQEDADYYAYFYQKSYNIDVSVHEDSRGMGTAEGSGTYYYGDRVWIEAVPYQGYEFDGWTDQNRDNPRLIIVTCNDIYRCRFRVKASTDDAQSLAKVYAEGLTAVVISPEAETRIELPCAGVYIVSVNNRVHRITVK